MAKEQAKKTEKKSSPKDQKQTKNTQYSKDAKKGKIMVECKFGAKCTKGKQCRFLHTHKEEKKELTGREQKNEQKRIKLEHKLRRPDGELVFKAKEIWNRLRLVDLEKEERDLLVLKLMTLLKGKVVDISLKHDGSRIIQSLYKYGNAEQRSSLTKEILKSVVVMSKTKHGRFLVQSLLRYSSKEDIEEFIKAITGKVQSLAIHQIGSHVLEYAYEEILTQRQSFLLFEELYHRQYMNMKDTESTSAKQIVEKNPLLQDKIVANLFVVITKMINKALLDNSYAHKILYDYLTIADSKQIMMLMDQLDNAFPALSTTHLGSQFIIEGLNYCSNKNKRKILKSYKGIIADTAVHQFGYLIIIKLLYCIDDTVLLNKTIFKELSVNYQQLLESSYGCRVLLSILSPKNHSYFENDSLFVVPSFTIKNDKGEKEEVLTAKKDFDTRVKELQEKLVITPALLASFPMCAVNNGAIHVIVETIVNSEESNSKSLLAAFRECIEKSLQSPDSPLSAGVNQQAMETVEEEEPEEEEEEEEQEMDQEEGEEEEGEEEEGEEGEGEEDEGEGEEEEGEEGEGEEPEEEEEPEVPEEPEVELTYKDIWNSDAWTVLCKRVVSLLSESDKKALLTSEVVTPLKQQFMSLIETYPSSLFFIRKLMKCDVTSKDVIAQLKPKKNALSKLFASGNYKGYDDVMEMLGGKK